MKKIFIVLTLLATVSCNDDFLERESPNQLSESTFWQNERDAVLGINGVYDALQDRVLYSGSLNATASAGIAQHDGFTDNAYNNYKFEGPGNFMEGNADPSHQYFYNFWASLYKGIRRANSAIENMSAMSSDNITDAKRNELIGQARFLRALFYFNVAVYFEEAPLITSSQTLGDSYVPKNSYDELSAQIVEDLEFAAANLPDQYPAASYGYATKGAALSLHARFSLYNKQYEKVVDLTTQVMTLGYSLNTNYAQLFTEAGETSKEIVFAVRFLQNPAYNNGETFSATFLGIPRVNMQPMRNLVNDYYCRDGRPITSSPLYSAANPNANRDPRLIASVYFRNDIFLIGLNRRFMGNTATTFGQKKWIRNDPSPSGISVDAPGGQDFYVLRYADVLLMRAEALAQLGQLTEVYTLVNSVRARVSMPTIQSVEGSNLSAAALLNIIAHERRVELAFEGLRFFDLKRWGKMGEAYTRAVNDKVAGFNPLYRNRKSEVFPIPQNELDANENLGQIGDWQ